MGSSTIQDGAALEERQRLLKLQPANEILDVHCSAARIHATRECGLRHRLPKVTVESDAVGDHDGEKCLLDERIAKSSQSSLSLKTHFSGFSKCIEKYLTACRVKVRFKPRRPAKPKKAVTPPQKRQTDLEGEHGCNVSCFGQGWRGLRKRLGGIIKIEEEICISAPRSVLYYV